MELVHELTLTAHLKPMVPFGRRIFVEVASGTVVGERVNGRLLTGGGDWAVIGDHGLAAVDVRTSFVTDDGVNVYSEYTGLLELNEAVLASSTGGPETQWADQYFRTTPRFETTDERYRWMTTCLWVGEGRMLAGGVEYRMYRLT